MLWFFELRLFIGKFNWNPKIQFDPFKYPFVLEAISSTNQIFNNPQIQEANASSENYQSTDVFSSSEIGEVLHFMSSPFQSIHVNKITVFSVILKIE